MRRSFVLTIACVAGFALASAQDDMGQKGSSGEGETMTVRGYVVDAMCAQRIAKKDNVTERAAAHTKECALEEACAASGFGVFVEGKYIKFDAHGDQLAQELVEKSRKEKGIAVQVTGTLEADQLVVASMEETMMNNSQDDDKADVKEGAVEDQEP